jgi:hypothetical protein
MTETIFVQVFSLHKKFIPLVFSAEIPRSQVILDLILTGITWKMGFVDHQFQKENLFIQI